MAVAMLGLQGRDPRSRLPCANPPSDCDLFKRGFWGGGGRTGDTVSTRRICKPPQLRGTPGNIFFCLSVRPNVGTAGCTAGRPASQHDVCVACVRPSASQRRRISTPRLLLYPGIMVKWNAAIPAARERLIKPKSALGEKINYWG